MTKCNRCNDQQEYEWYEDQYGKWKLGIKLDVNNYRQHRCIQEKSQEPEKNVKFPDRRGWIKFICEACGETVMKSKKHFSTKEPNLCGDCSV